MARKNLITVRTFVSKTATGKSYTVKKDDKGVLYCDCPVWIYNKYGDRTCYHTRTVEALDKVRAVTEKLYDNFGRDFGDEPKRIIRVP